VAVAALLGASPPRPEGCRAVTPGASLQSELDEAAEGTALCLAAGDYAGPVVLRSGRALWGPREAVIRSSGTGTTVRLEGEGAALLGLTVDGSGGRFDLLDAAVHVAGRGARVEGVRVHDAVFGILVERASSVLVRANEVVGDATRSLGLRGDGIRLWECTDSVVEDNFLDHGRDMVLWYASRNRIAHNRVEGGRYGAHLMYSHENEVTGNDFIGNVTGLFIMYSRDVAVRRNVFAHSGGAAGIGLGMKESGNLDVRDNLFVDDTLALYVDTSPLWPDDRNVFEGNVFRLNDVAVGFLGRAGGNRFENNVFRDSQVQVEVSAGNAREAEWRANYFDDYAGYDLDGDGSGDLPYEPCSLTQDLIAAAPSLAFFRGTPALAMAEAIGRIVPLLELRPILRDPAPRMQPREWERARAD
jgi:nitrous oxidase accessory protein